MIHTSLIAYLKTGQLGPFAQLLPRQSLLDTLGPPPFWDGWGGIPYEKSTVWVYDSIQFNFDDDYQIADTHIGFDCKFNNGSVSYSDWENRFLQFNDLAIDAICTPELFVETMKQNAIATTQNVLSGGRVMIDTEAGVQARFGTLSDYDASKALENPVRTNCAYLHRVTTVKLA